MLEESRLVKMIRKGDLDKLKKFLEKNPSFLTKNVCYDGPHDKYHANHDICGNILTVAISFNQSEIIKYLVTEKSFNPNRLHFDLAASHGSYEAVVTLLELGLIPEQRNRWGHDAYSFSKDQRMKDLLLPYHQEFLQEEREAAEAEIAGIWGPVSPQEVAHHHQPEGQNPLTDIFNFATRRMTSVGGDPDSSQLPFKTVSFDDLSAEEVAQATAKLKEFNGGITENDGIIEVGNPALPQFKRFVF